MAGMFGDYIVPNYNTEVVNHPKWPVLDQPYNRDMMKLPFRVHIEGNIGCGKSTLAKLLAELTDVQLFEEPVNEWRQVGHDEWGQPINLLDNFYSAPTAFSSVMQLSAVESYIKLAAQPVIKPIVLQERSLFSCQLFTEMLQDQKMLTDNEVKNINDLTDHYMMNQLEHYVPDLTIYLQSSPVVCFDRMTARCRPEEKDKVSREYLVELHRKHQQWLLSDWPYRVLVLDAHENPLTLALTATKQIYNGLHELRMRMLASRLYQTDIIRAPDEDAYLREEAYGQPLEVERVRFRSYYRDTMEMH